MKYTFVYETVATIKVFKGDIYDMYCDPTLNSLDSTSKPFKSSLEFKHESIHMQMDT
jgi:hypothetical protein